MARYKRLTQEQRYQISNMLWNGFNQTEIALAVGCHKSTISRELTRNTGLRGYRHKQAQRLAEGRVQEKARPAFAGKVWQKVEHRLRQGWSPEQISGRLRLEEGIRISTEWIYQYIYWDMAEGGNLHRCLRCQKRHRKAYGKSRRKGGIPGRVGIEERPVLVDERSRLGDWEVDTVIGKGHQGALVTLVERKSRFTLVRHVRRKTADLVAQATIGMLRPHAEKTRTITADNGREFAAHSKIASALEAKVYFADPYASWERGTNENTNGLIRQYFPKGRKLIDVTRKEVNHVMRMLNNRPRKCLGFMTPAEVFFDIHPPVALGS